MTPWIFPISQDAREALEAAGVQGIPAEIVFTLRSASQREMEYVEAAQTPTGLLNTDPIAFLAELLRRRADPPVSVDVCREVARDIPFSEVGAVIFAFVRGERGDEKKIRAVTSQTLNGMTDQMLDALLSSETAPSSPDTTE